MVTISVLNVVSAIPIYMFLPSFIASGGGFVYNIFSLTVSV